MTDKATVKTENKPRQETRGIFEDNADKLYDQPVTNYGFEGRLGKIGFSLDRIDVIHGGNLSAGSPMLQTKLLINEPGDKCEQEADAMADKVMRMPIPGLIKNNFLTASTIQRECAHCEEEEQKMKIRRKENVGEQTHAETIFPTYINSLGNSGTPLSKGERNFFEPRFGYDFSKVRIHKDAAAANSARSINAQAYTFGNNIVFNNGK